MAQRSSTSSFREGPRRSLHAFLDALLSFLTTLLHPAIALFSTMVRNRKARKRRQNENSNAAAVRTGDDPDMVALANISNANALANGAASPAARTASPSATAQDHNSMNGHALTAVGNSTAGAGDAAMLNKENVASVRETSVLDEQIIAGVAGLDITSDENGKQQNGHVTSAPLSRVGSSTTDDNEDPVKAEQRRIHQGFMNDALDMVSSASCHFAFITHLLISLLLCSVRRFKYADMNKARLALKTNETPVGCVLVCNGRVVARGMNATNITRNGTRHAELMAICALTSCTKEKDLEKPTKRGGKGARTSGKDKVKPEPAWGDVDPEDGHLYPYGQKLHPAPRVDRSIISECTLYVTVEPCVMCASLLRQYGIKKVFFGAVNDKFGGTGGVFNIHMNAGSTGAPQDPALRPPTNKHPRPPLARMPTSANGSVNSADKDSVNEDGAESIRSEIPEPRIAMPLRIGDGGNVEPGYEVEGGWGRDEAVNLLRQFYVQENGRAPVPRKKEGRAARLAAMMEKDGMSIEGTTLADELAANSAAATSGEETVAASTNGDADTTNGAHTNGGASVEAPEPVPLASTTDAKA